MYRSEQTMNTACLFAQTPTKHATLLLTSSLYCMLQCQTGRWVGHPTTSDIQPSERQGHGLCPVVFIILKCSAKMDAGRFSLLGPNAVSKETIWLQLISPPILLVIHDLKRHDTANHFQPSILVVHFLKMQKITLSICHKNMLMLSSGFKLNKKHANFDNNTFHVCSKLVSSTNMNNAFL